MKRVLSGPGSFSLDDLIAAAREDGREEVGDDEVRAALKAELLPFECLGYRIVDELGVCDGAARVDVAAIGAAELVGYEIKSELDSLQRLAQQRDIFNSVFDRMTLVVAAPHLARAKAIVPTWWGLVEITRDARRVELRRVRDALKNPAPDVGATLSLLWVAELAAVAALIGVRVRGFRKNEIIERLAGAFDAPHLREAVTDRLLNRRRWRPGSLHT